MLTPFSVGPVWLVSSVPFDKLQFPVPLCHKFLEIFLWNWKEWFCPNQWISSTKLCLFFWEIWGKSHRGNPEQCREVNSRVKVANKSMQKTLCTGLVYTNIRYSSARTKLQCNLYGTEVQYKEMTLQCIIQCPIERKVVILWLLISLPRSWGKSLASKNALQGR